MVGQHVVNFVALCELLSGVSLISATTGKTYDSGSQLHCAAKSELNTWDEFNSRVLTLKYWSTCKHGAFCGIFMSVRSN